jgi:hypothetical protein
MPTFIPARIGNTDNSKDFPFFGKGLQFSFNFLIFTAVSFDLEAIWGTKLVECALLLVLGKAAVLC